jgi:hypothetical protein
MQSLANARQIFTASIQKLLGGSSSSADRRQAFKTEFGFFPVASEAPEAERTVFAHESVRPVLQQRASVINHLAQEATDTTKPPVTDASRLAKQAAFNRAYRLATDLKLAEKGLSYQAFLSSSDQS